MLLLAAEGLLILDVRGCYVSLLCEEACLKQGGRGASDAWEAYVEASMGGLYARLHSLHGLHHLQCCDCHRLKRCPFRTLISCGYHDQPNQRLPVAFPGDPIALRAFCKQYVRSILYTRVMCTLPPDSEAGCLERSLALGQPPNSRNRQTSPSRPRTVKSCARTTRKAGL